MIILAETAGNLSAAVDDLQAAVIDDDSASIKELCCKASGILEEKPAVQAE